MGIMIANKTQKQCVREYLDGGNSITPLIALGMFGAYRLSAIIYDLKKDGYKVATQLGQDANGKRFARYFKAA